jgi:hypothetical protein
MRVIILSMKRKRKFCVARERVQFESRRKADDYAI